MGSLLIQVFYHYIVNIYSIYLDYEPFDRDRGFSILSMIVICDYVFFSSVSTFNNEFTIINSLHKMMLIHNRMMFC